MANVWLDKARIIEAFQRGAEDALDEIGDVIAADAKRRAPIRKVFKEPAGYRQKTRALTSGEKTQAIERAERYYTKTQPNEFKRRRAIGHIRNYARVGLQTRGSANAPRVSAKARLLGFERGGKFFPSNPGTRRTFNSRTGSGYEPDAALKSKLTGRGLYEVRSGRAIHIETVGGRTRVKIGGALKASIGNEGVVQTGNGVKVTVEAAIWYAPFVEFPTIHNRAQPFLLPALHAQRQNLARKVAKAIKQNLGG